MNYLLDTNIVAFFLRGAYLLDAKIREVSIENIQLENWVVRQKS